MSKLSDISNTIPSILRTHHREITIGAETWYFGELVHKGDESSVIWEWHMHVKVPGRDDSEEPLIIWCRKSLLRADHVPLRLVGNRLSPWRREAWQW